MMTIQTAPTWFALQILLQGTEHRKDVASNASYWSSLSVPGENLLCRLKAELFEAYSELNIPPDVHQHVKDFVAQLSLLRESQLIGNSPTDFQVKAKAALEVVSDQLGSSNSSS